MVPLWASYPFPYIFISVLCRVGLASSSIPFSVGIEPSDRFSRYRGYKWSSSSFRQSLFFCGDRFISRHFHFQRGLKRRRKSILSCSLWVIWVEAAQFGKNSVNPNNPPEVSLLIPLFSVSSKELCAINSKTSISFALVSAVRAQISLKNRKDDPLPLI